MRSDDIDNWFMPSLELVTNDILVAQSSSDGVTRSELESVDIFKIGVKENPFLACQRSG